jgi:hypothetical protein
MRPRPKDLGRNLRSREPIIKYVLDVMNNAPLLTVKRLGTKDPDVVILASWSELPSVRDLLSSKDSESPDVLPPNRSTARKQFPADT